MIEAVTMLPPIVLADLLGLYPSTAETWATYANDGWTHHLAARGQPAESIVSSGACGPVAEVPVQLARRPSASAEGEAGSGV